jgi:LuxR family maltose regulon positive regulatory protein
MDDTILKTKLQPPHLPDDYIFKYNQIKYLNIDIERPLTLVSAGAGFGKSTFVSSWLKQLDYKSGWISLDENDNNLQTFLKYFIAAVQQSVSDFGQKTQILLSTPNMPPSKLLINSLMNDLNELDELFILVLDDIYLIKDKEIYNLLTTLVKYPPQNFHLVLISRSDPPLPLTKLRASNKIKEIRISDLQFTESETEKFVKRFLNIGQYEDIVSLLKTKTEGWVTGLRLAMMHIAYHYKSEEDIKEYLTKLSFSESYFIEEVLASLDDTTVEFLLKTSVLNKFCVPLTDFILSQDGGSPAGREIIEQLIKKNLFIINLDEENKWFRYHHLFQSLLQKKLKDKYSNDIIDELHKRALEWFEKESYINDALLHATQINDLKLIAGLIEKHMHKPLNENKWYNLAQWLTKIPDNYIYQSPALLIAKMWILHHKNAMWLIPEQLQKLEEIRKTQKLDTEIELQMQFFQGVILFWNAQIEESMLLFEHVRNNVSQDKIGTLSLASIYYATAAQMYGTGKEVYLEYEKIIYGKNVNPNYKSILFGTLIYIKLQDGELYVAESITNRFKKYSKSVNDVFAQTWSDYIFGYIAFQQNKLDSAYDYFGKALKNVYFLNMGASVDCFAGMLLTLKILNKNQEYNQVYKQFISFVNEQNDPAYLSTAYSVRARLALLGDDTVSAVKLMKMAELFYDSGNTLFYIESPRLTYCKVLLSQNKPDKTEKALEKLDKHLELAKKTKNIPQYIRVNILRAVAFEKKNMPKEATKALADALIKAQAGYWVTPFLEEREQIQTLLKNLVTKEKTSEFASMLLNEFSLNNKKSLESSATLLTNREFDIILLLSKRLSNQEIANKLFISETTVKRHTINIYKKLHVHNRREAVQKAKTLNLLHHSDSN